MNAAPSAAPMVPTRRPADLRTVDRVLAAVLMPLGPAAAAVIRYVIPGEPVGASVTAAPDAQRLVLVMGAIITFTMVPGALAALRLMRRRAPRLVLWTGAFLVPGYLAMLTASGMDLATMAAYDAGFSPAGIDRINAAVWAQPTMMVFGGVFVIGHIVGTVLLGATMIASRTTAIPIGIAMAVSQPLHFVALVVLASRELDLLAWGTTAVCMGVLAWHVLRTPNDEWDLPPDSVTHVARANRRVETVMVDSTTGFADAEGSGRQPAEDQLGGGR